MGGGEVSIEYFLGLDTGNGMTALVHRSVIKNWANQSSRYEWVTTRVPETKAGVESVTHCEVLQSLLEHIAKFPRFVDQTVQLG